MAADQLGTAGPPGVPPRSLGTAANVLPEQEGFPQQGRGTDLRLAVTAACVWTGVLAGLGSSLARALVIGALGCAGMAAGLAAPPVNRRRAPRWALTTAVCSAAVLVGFIVGMVAAANFRNDPVASTLHGELTLADVAPVFVDVTGRVTKAPVPIQTPWANGALRLDVAAESVLNAGRPIPSDVNLWVEVPRDLQGDNRVLVPGARIELRGLLDSQDWLRPPVAGRLRASAIGLVAGAPWWQSFAADLRESMRRVVEPAGIDGPLISGMSLGDDSMLDPRIKDAMLVTSLTHLTAVSGSHIAITLGVINWLLRGRRRLQACATASFLLLIVVVVGPEPSVIRATAMGALAVWGVFWRRPSQPLAMLGAVVLAVVLLEPWLAVSVGFTLSSIATAGIILLARPGEQLLLARLPPGSLTKAMLSPVGGATAVAAVAQAVTLPVLALLNPWLPTWGMVANLAVAPVVAPLTLLGLGAAATCLWAPGVAQALVWLAGPLAAWVRVVAQQVANWPLAQFPCPQGPGGSVLVLVTLFSIALTARRVQRVRAGHTWND